MPDDDIEFLDESDATAPVAAQIVDVETEEIIDAEAVVPHGEPCAACGSPVEADDKFCPACGNPSPNAREAEAVEQAELSPLQKFIRCETCGAEVAMSTGQRSYTCAFCDSTYVVEFSPAATGRQRPEFVIGFAVTHEQALAKFQQWIQDNRWYRPGDLKTAEIAERLRGVYLPFWSFSMLAESGWDADIGEYWYETQTYTTRDSNGKMVTKTRRVRRTEWWDLWGRHHRYYSGYLVSGSRGLSQADADRVKPFQLPALRRYEPSYLAGWMSEEYSIEREQALEICQQEFYRREQANVAAFLPGDTHRQLQVRTNFSQINSDLCLLPIYILSYRYKDKLYRFLVNGQTGKVAGDKPVSWSRIGIVIGGVLAVLVLFILLLILIMGLGG